MKINKKFCKCGDIIFCKGKCKSCYNKEYKKNNKQKISEYDKKYSAENREEINKKRRERYKKDPSKVLSRQKKSYDNNPDKFLNRNAIWRNNNLELKREIDQKYRDENKEELNKKNSVWKKNNKGKVNFQNSKRRATKLQATPPWLTKEQLIQIKEIYELASKMSKEQNREFHVDHIMPLQGENSCGLHVPWNLQILPKEDNLRKGNKV